MNDMSTPPATGNDVVATEQPGRALSALSSEAIRAMPIALALYLDDALYDRVSSIAARMSKADGITPKHLLGKPEACFAVVTRAITWRLDPFAVGAATYQTPGGQIGFEGKLIHAILENSGRLEQGGVSYEHYGDWSKVQGRFEMRESKNDASKKYAAPTWTDNDARAAKPDNAKWPFAQSCGVRVSAHLRGETKPRFLDFDLIQAQPRNSTLWATDPMTQICYTGVRRFASSVVPSLIMGVPFDPVDNLEPAPGMRDITPDAGVDEFMPRAATGAEQALDAVVESAARQAAIDKAQQTAQTKGQQQPAESIDRETGEIKSGAQQQAEPPAQGTLVGNGEGPQQQASAAQKNMLLEMAKRKGWSGAQLDEVLVATYTVGLDELPMMVVNKAAQLIASHKKGAA